MLIVRRNPFNGKKYQWELPITDAQYESWQGCGILIQHAMPNLNPDQREFVKTGILPEQWDEFLSEVVFKYPRFDSMLGIITTLGNILDLANFK